MSRSNFYIFILRDSATYNLFVVLKNFRVCAVTEINKIIFAGHVVFMLHPENRVNVIHLFARS